MISFKRLIFVALAFFASYSTKAQMGESKVKAVFIYNFTKYIDWQPAEGKITIGVYGNDAVLDILQQDIVNRRIQGNEVVVERITSPAEVSRCQVIYLPKSQSGKLSELVALTEQKGVLLITEDNLAKEGAGISFIKQSSKLTFVINRTMLENEHKLKVMGTLYNMGKVI